MRSHLLVLLSLCLLASAFLAATAFADDVGTPPQAYADQLHHTYSIVARDAETGELGVAVQTHWFAVGTRVPWAEAKVGAIATQSFTNPDFGPDGLAMLREGKSAQETLDALIAADEARDVRQLAIVDAEGRVAAWTGEKCIPAAGHHLGDGFSVQANLMWNDDVWPDMARAFESTEGPLAERMLAALEAGQAAGGDIRGRQSAALLVVSGEPTGTEWRDRLVDLRVDDAAEPVKELGRLLALHRAYDHMNAGDVAVEHDDFETAREAYGAAQDLFPDNLEMKYWNAVSLANKGRMGEALPIFATVFAGDDAWRELTGRLPGVGLLTVSAEDLKTILTSEHTGSDGTASAAHQASTPPPFDLATAKVVDLSHTYGADTLYWPTSPSAFELKELAHGVSEGGWFYSANLLCTPEHGGTHLDAPIHFHDDVWTSEQIPAERFVRPVVVIDVSEQAAADPDYVLSLGDLGAWESEHGAVPAGAIVLLRTGWDARWPDRLAYLGDDTPGDASNLHFPSFGEEAAKLLVERGVYGLGVDTASIDSGNSTTFPVHRVAAAQNVFGLENLRGLSQLPVTGAWIAALPMKIEGGSGGPARVVAFVAE